MDEGIFIEEAFQYNQLTIYDDCAETVAVYLNGEFIGDAEVYTDRENDDREYICINNEIVYLDTLEDQ